MQGLHAWREGATGWHSDGCWLQKYATYKWDGLKKMPLRMYKLYHLISFKILLQKCEASWNKSKRWCSLLTKGFGRGESKRQTNKNTPQKVVGLAKAVERNQKMDMHGRCCARSSEFPGKQERVMESLWDRDTNTQFLSQLSHLKHCPR